MFDIFHITKWDCHLKFINQNVKSDPLVKSAFCKCTCFVTYGVRKIVSINVNACQSYKTIIYQIPLFGNDWIHINSFSREKKKVVAKQKQYVLSYKKSRITFSAGSYISVYYNFKNISNNDS